MLHHNYGACALESECHPTKALHTATKAQYQKKYIYFLKRLDGWGGRQHTRAAGSEGRQEQQGQRPHATRVQVR